MALVLTPQAIPSGASVGAPQPQGSTLLPQRIEATSTIGAGTRFYLTLTPSAISSGAVPGNNPFLVLNGNVVYANDGSGDTTLLMEAFNSDSQLIGSPNFTLGYFPPNIPITRPIRALSTAERYSGIVVSQNKTPPDDGFVSVDQYDGYQYYQEFLLPDNFSRAGKNTPPLTGIQIYANVAAGYEDVAAYDWTIQHYAGGWKEIGSGTTVGVPFSGDVWFSAYAKKPIEILAGWVNDRFRIGIRGRVNNVPRVKELVPYDAGQVEIDGAYIDAPLELGIPYHLVVDGVPSVLYQDAQTEKVYYSVEQGINKIYATHPNPLAPQAVKAYEGDGTTSLVIDGDESSLMFRVMGGVVDAGEDFLGNPYRSAIVRDTPENTITVNGELVNQTWLSKPNPSRFAIESLYFDITDNGNRQTIDRILLDPLTPDIFCNVYYSSEGVAGTNDTEWDNKVWQRVPDTWQLKRKETYALPEPITAKYLKLEFTHLQPRWYAPGGFSKPMVYKKHPKWVLDYFLTRMKRFSEDPFIGREIEIEFDFYDFAYNYYLDDLRQEPLNPVQLGNRSLQAVSGFLKERGDISDTVDADTFSQIQAELFPYRNSIQGKLDYLLSTWALATSNENVSGNKAISYDYPVEELNQFEFGGIDVSVLNRDEILIEKGLPATFFFIPCRHQYRMVTANFSHDRAYFAGIQEIALMRDQYNNVHDSPLYVESTGDYFNVARGDFVLTNGGSVWSTYTDNDEDEIFIPSIPGLLTVEF